MAVKIRLQRHGRKQNPYYKIVIADARSPRDGKYIERLGFYNPMTVPATIEIDRDKALDWLNKGAQPTDTVRAILRYKGVMFKKHLLRGVAKGAMTLEVAEAKWQEFIQEKDSKALDRKKSVAKEKQDYLNVMSGTAKPVVKAEPAVQVDETPAAVEETATEEAAVVSDAPVAEDASVEAPVATEAIAVEEAPAAEEAPAVEEAPATEEAPAAEEAPVADEAPATEDAPAAEEETTEPEA